MSAITSEIERFNRLSTTWWDEHGPMRPLHVTNQLRLRYIEALIREHFAATAEASLDGLRVLDVGCGAGLMCEPLATRGAQVTGLDAADKNIAAGRIHAQANGIEIDYRTGTPDSALSPDERYHVVLLLEVVEHVESVPDFVATAAKHLAPGGLLVASTINRTLKSFVFAIVGAEYVFRVLPRGTHSWSRFVKPQELDAAARNAGLEPSASRGMRYLPVVHRAWWSRDRAVNYISCYDKPKAAGNQGSEQQ